MQTRQSIPGPKTEHWPEDWAQCCAKTRTWDTQAWVDVAHLKKLRLTTGLV